MDIHKRTIGVILGTNNDILGTNMFILETHIVILGTITIILGENTVISHIAYLPLAAADRQNNFALTVSPPAVDYIMYSVFQAGLASQSM